MSNQDTDNITAFPNKAEIKEEAGAWFVRIETGALGESDLAELREWVERSDFHRDYLLEIAATWDSMGVLRELSDIFPLPEKEPHRERPSFWLAGAWDKLKSLGRLPVTVTAATAGLLVVLLVQLNLVGPAAPQTFVTAVGERASHTLADGTTVVLNTNSKLTVKFSDDRRAVTLVHGEANFDVAKNPQRPFVVYAGDGMVWAVGTAFNVRRTAVGVDVTVTEGTVKVFSDIREAPDLHTVSNEIVTSKSAKRPDVKESQQPARKEALLNAGEAIRYTQVIEILEPVVDEEIKRKLAWQQGSLVFKGETLQQAVDEIGRYTDKKIVIADPFLAGLRVGGHYKTDDIDALFASLGRGLDIQIRQTNNRIVLAAKADR